MDKSLEKKLNLWLRLQKKACGWYLNFSVFLGCLNALAIIFQAYLLASILNGVIIDSLPARHFETMFYAVIVTFLLRGLIAFSREKVSFIAGLTLRKAIRQQVLNKLHGLGPAFIKGKPAGEWASIVFEQIEDLQDYYARYLPQMSLAVFIPLMIILVVLPLNWAAACILLITAPLIPFFMMLVGWGAADANRKNFNALARLSGHFMDRLKGLATLKLFYKTEQELTQIKQASEDFRQRTMSVLRLAFLSSAVLEFFAAVSIAVLAVYFGFSYLGELNFGHYGAEISLFTGLFVLMLAPEFYQPLRDMGTHYHAKAQAVGAAEALFNLLEYKEKILTGTKTITAIKSIYAKNLKIYSLDGTLLVGPISFSLTGDEHVAIVGPSGAGKTSLINGLLGFLPYEGELMINGIPFNKLDIQSYRQHVGWLGQEPQLFHGTLKSNIDVSASHRLSDEEISQYLKAAALDELLIKNKGLDYAIGENANKISVGQAQRIALARMLAKRPSFYLLDEPTASLDNVSEQLVQQSLAYATGQKLSLMITHRIDALLNASHILVMEQGKIVQKGSFASLKGEKGVFSDMLNDNTHINNNDISGGDGH